jgi:hypothetical protein
MESKQPQKKENSEPSTSPLRSILDGSLFYNKVIKGNLSYIIFCTFLLVFYIGNRYKSEEQLTTIASLEKEISELRYESITTSAELMSISRQSEVYNLVKEKGLDLHESVKAPQRIFIENN